MIVWDLLFGLTIHQFGIKQFCVHLVDQLDKRGAHELKSLEFELGGLGGPKLERSLRSCLDSLAALWEEVGLEMLRGKLFEFLVKLYFFHLISTST